MGQAERFQVAVDAIWSNCMQVKKLNYCRDSRTLR